MVYVKTVKNVIACYRKEKENLEIGDASVQYILYNFREGKLVGVYIRFADLSNFKKFKKMLFYKYGSTEENYKKLSNISDEGWSVKYIWEGTDVTIVLYFNRSACDYTSGSGGYDPDYNSGGGEIEYYTKSRKKLKKGLNEL